MNVIDPAIFQTLVQKDRVHRSIYIDPAIFDLEMQRIFGRSWVYVGHESQVPKAGDYVTARIGSVPVVLSRHKNGKVHVLFNSCGHRGAIVCNEERGNVKLFRCAYHGWTDGYCVDARSLQGLSAHAGRRDDRARRYCWPIRSMSYRVSATNR